MRSPLMTVFAAAVLALAVALGRWFVGCGFAARPGDRFDRKGRGRARGEGGSGAVPMLVARSNQLAEAQQKIGSDTDIDADFPRGERRSRLRGRGSEPAGQRPAGAAISHGAHRKPFHRRPDLDGAHGRGREDAAATQKIGDLVAAGIVLGGEGQPSPGPSLTKLNDIKPAMIADATKSASEGAEQFAKDSGSRSPASAALGRDCSRSCRATTDNQIAKAVRVVSTFDYRLAD